MCSASWRFRLQLLDLGDQLCVDDALSQGSDNLVADHAVLVDKEGLGRAIDTPVDGHVADGIESDCIVRVAILVEHGEGILPVILVIEPMDRQESAGGESHQHGMLFMAGSTPAGPYVEQAHLADEDALIQFLAGLTKCRK